jgi:hypothetical protein
MQWLVDVDFYVRVLKQNSAVAFSPDVLIATTDGAEHQVTKYFAGNSGVELLEYARLFRKISDRGTLCPEIDEVWDRLFDRYDIQFYCDFSRYGGTLRPVPAEYFKSLLRRRRRASENALKAELASVRAELASVRAELASKRELAGAQLTRLQRLRRSVAYLIEPALRIGRRVLRRSINCDGLG